MSKTELLNRLQKLHDELNVINQELDQENRVDDQTVDALKQLVRDANDLVETAEFSTDSTSDSGESHPLNDRIREFEDNHPRISRFLAEFSDLLAMMGI